jgi:hypothetical protein
VGSRRVVSTARSSQSTAFPPIGKPPDRDLGHFPSSASSFSGVRECPFANFGLLRHATFEGLRDDKTPREVIRER